MIRRRRLPREHLLPLRAALLARAPAEDALPEWRGSVDFEAVATPVQRLLPLIHRNLGSEARGDPVLGRIRGIYRRTWVLNAIQMGEGERAIAALGEEEIPTMLLKGAAMIARWTGDSGVRMMSDFDLLVPRERARDAIARLRAAGARPLADRPNPPTQPAPP